MIKKTLLVFRTAGNRVNLATLFKARHVRLFSGDNNRKFLPSIIKIENQNGKSESTNEPLSDAAMNASRSFGEAADAMGNVSDSAIAMRRGFQGASKAMFQVSLSSKKIEAELAELEKKTKEQVEDLLEYVRKKILTGFGGILFALLVLGLLFKRTKIGRKFIRQTIERAAVDEIQEVSKNVKQEIETLQIKIKMLEELSQEIQRLQTKYNSSLFGSLFFSPISRGYSHGLKIQALTALRKEITQQTDASIFTAGDFSGETIRLLSEAYHFDTLPEAADDEFKSKVLDKQMKLSA